MTLCNDFNPYSIKIRSPFFFNLLFGGYHFCLTIEKEKHLFYQRNMFFVGDRFSLFVFYGLIATYLTALTEL
jgi:hypothetical protein